MFHILILLISLCDFYPASAPDDSFFKDFPVVEQLDDKWTGCTECPFSGGPDYLTIQLKHETIDPSDESLVIRPNRLIPPKCRSVRAVLMVSLLLFEERDLA